MKGKMEEQHVLKMTAALDVLSSIEGISEQDRDFAYDIIKKSFDTAVIVDDEVRISKEAIRREAKRIAQELPLSEVMKWVGNDPAAERRIEEYVRLRYGWDGHGFAPLLRGCREFALIRIVYAALTTVKTVVVK